MLENAEFFFVNRGLALDPYRLILCWPGGAHNRWKKYHHLGSWVSTILGRRNSTGSRILVQEDQVATEHHFRILFGKALVISFFLPSNSLMVHSTFCLVLCPSNDPFFGLFFGQVHCLSRLLSLSTNYAFSRVPGKRPQKPFWPKADIKLNNEK